MGLISKILYGLYAAVLFTVVALLAILVMAVLPGLSRRRRVARRAIRSSLARQFHYVHECAFIGGHSDWVSKGKPRQIPAAGVKFVATPLMQ